MSATSTTTGSTSLLGRVAPRGPVPLLLSSFPTPPSHIPPSPLSASSHSSSSPLTTPSPGPLGTFHLHVNNTAAGVNPPPSLPPTGPLPPVPGPSPISERESLLLVSAHESTRSRSGSNLSRVSPPGSYGHGKQDSGGSSGSVRSLKSAYGPETDIDLGVVHHQRPAIPRKSSSGSLAPPSATYSPSLRAQNTKSPTLAVTMARSRAFSDSANLTTMTLDELNHHRFAPSPSPIPFADQDPDDMDLPPSISRRANSNDELAPLPEDDYDDDTPHTPSQRSVFPTQDRRAADQQDGALDAYVRSTTTRSSIASSTTSLSTTSSTSTTPSHIHSHIQTRARARAPSLPSKITSALKRPPALRSSSGSDAVAVAVAVKRSNANIDKEDPEKDRGSPDIETMIAKTPRPRRRSSSHFSTTTTTTSTSASIRSRRSSTFSRPGSEWDRDFGLGAGGVDEIGIPLTPEADGHRAYAAAVVDLDDENLDRGVDGDGDRDGSDSDSSIDLHTPLPHILLRTGYLSPHSKLLPQSARSPSPLPPLPSSATATTSASGTGGMRPGSGMSMVSNAGSVMTKSGIFKDERDTVKRRTRHRDGRLLKGGIGLTTGLGWSDSEDEDAPSALTRRVSALTLSRRASTASSLRSSSAPRSSMASASQSRSSFSTPTPSRTNSTRSAATSAGGGGGGGGGGRKPRASLPQPSWQTKQGLGQGQPASLTSVASAIALGNGNGENTVIGDKSVYSSSRPSSDKDKDKDRSSTTSSTSTMSIPLPITPASAGVELGSSSSSHSSPNVVREKPLVSGGLPTPRKGPSSFGFRSVSASTSTSASSTNTANGAGNGILRNSSSSSSLASATASKIGTTFMESSKRAHSPASSASSRGSPRISSASPPAMPRPLRLSLSSSSSSSTQQQQQQQQQLGKPTTPKTGTLLGYNRNIHDQQRMRAYSGPPPPSSALAKGVFSSRMPPPSTVPPTAPLPGPPTSSSSSLNRPTLPAPLSPSGLRQPRIGTGMVYRTSSAGPSSRIRSAYSPLPSPTYPGEGVQIEMGIAL